jgi:type VI secretion system protein ImpF
VTRAGASARFSTSLLDRLIDDAPDRAIDPPIGQSEVMRATRENIRRDLEAILNTRRLCVTTAPELSAIRTALPNFGVTDLVGTAIGTPEQRAELVRTLEETIRIFEPRFRTVTLILVKSRDPHDRALRFRIEAIVFESKLDPATRSFSVAERADA